MANYPDLPLALSSTRTIDNGLHVDRADDGTPWVRSFYTQAYYQFSLDHRLLSPSQADLLDLFYRIHATEKISLLYKKDGTTYDCFFTAPPQIDRQNATFWRAQSHLIGTSWSVSQLFKNNSGVFFDFQNTATLIKNTDSGLTADVGETVEQIKDLSGVGNNATQPTSASRPLLQADASGKRYLDFDGLSHCYDMTGLTTPVGDHTAIFALEPHYSGPNESWLFDALTGRLVFGDRGDSARQVGYFTNGWHTVAAPTNAPQIVTFVLSGSTGVVYRGNTILGSATYTPAGMGGTTGLCANHDGTGFFYKGKLYGMILVATALAGDLQSAQQWMSQQSGIPL